MELIYLGKPSNLWPDNMMEGKALILNYRNTISNTILRRILQTVWAKEYNIISEANLLLESLEKKGNILNPTLYNVIKGEALAIRAMCHFDLIRLFAKGNLAGRREILTEPCIPYVTEYSKEITDQRSNEQLTIVTPRFK